MHVTLKTRLFYKNGYKYGDFLFTTLKSNDLRIHKPKKKEKKTIIRDILNKLNYKKAV